MSNQYNLYNLEALFKQFLVAGIEINTERTDNTNFTDYTDYTDKKERKSLKKISIKNYLSDLRHFLGWLMLYLKSKYHHLNINFNAFDSLPTQIEIIKQINDNTVQEYKSYLTENKIPIKTINRRLSTLRKFFSFCISQGWLKENPAKKIENLKTKIKNKDWELQKKSILNKFQVDLLKENIPQKTVNSFVNDIEEFLNSL